MAAAATKITIYLKVSKSIVFKFINKLEVYDIGDQRKRLSKQLDIICFVQTSSSITSVNEGVRATTKHPPIRWGWCIRSPSINPTWWGESKSWQTKLKNTVIQSKHLLTKLKQSKEPGSSSRSQSEQKERHTVLYSPTPPMDIPRVYVNMDHKQWEMYHAVPTELQDKWQHLHQCAGHGS